MLAVVLSVASTTELATPLMPLDLFSTWVWGSKGEGLAASSDLSTYPHFFQISNPRLSHNASHTIAEQFESRRSEDHFCSRQPKRRGHIQLKEYRDMRYWTWKQCKCGWLLLLNHTTHCHMTQTLTIMASQCFFSWVRAHSKSPSTIRLRPQTRIKSVWLSDISSALNSRPLLMWALTCTLHDGNMYFSRSIDRDVTYHLIKCSTQSSTTSESS